MRALVYISGGVTSWAELKLAVQEYGPQSTGAQFADVIIESRDTYRFMLEGAANAYGLPKPDALLAACDALPGLREMDARKAALAALREKAANAIPGLRWVADGRTPWDVFRSNRFIGNTRVDVCSRTLKRDVNHATLEAEFTPDTVVCHVGMTPDEERRKQRFSILAARKMPWRFRSLLIERGMEKPAAIGWARSEGLQLPEAYRLGHPHSNCGRGCVKQGHALWLQLLDTDPETFGWWEDEEAAWRAAVGKRNAILRDRRGGKTRPLTLRELRERHQAGMATEELMDLETANACGDACTGL